MGFFTPINTIKNVPFSYNFIKILGNIGFVLIKLATTEE